MHAVHVYRNIHIFNLSIFLHIFVLYLLKDHVVVPLISLYLLSKERMADYRNDFNIF